MDLFSKIVAMVSGLLFAMPAFAIDVEKIETNSGLSAVYLIKDGSRQQVRAELIIHAGEYDWNGPEGGPHYLEHLVYWHASKDVKKKYSYEQGGAHINGYSTHYVRSAPPSQLNETLDFVRRVFTRPVLDPQFMIDEREIVEREYDLRSSENPFAEAFDKLNAEFYEAHPLSRSVLGTIKSIRANRPTELFKFQKHFYQPANASLLITGNVSAEALRVAINEQFTDVPAGTRARRSWQNDIVLRNEQSTIDFTHRRIKFERLIDWRHMNSPKGWSREKTYIVLDLLQNILISTNKGSLAKLLRYDDFIAESFSLDFELLPNGDQVLKIFAKPDEDVSLNRLMEVYDDALKKIAKNGIPKKTFDRLRSKKLTTLKRLKDDLDAVINRAKVAIANGYEPPSFNNYIDEMEAVSLADINQLVKNLGAQARRVTMFVRPVGTK